MKCEVSRGLSVGVMAGTGVVVVGNLPFEMDVLYLMNDDAAWLERERYIWSLRWLRKRSQLAD